jgi:hypothetical protein
MNDHTKLRAFKLADGLAILIYQVTAGFPREELYGLTYQVRRAVVIEPKIIETEQVLNGLIRALRDE